MKEDLKSTLVSIIFSFIGAQSSQPEFTDPIENITVAIDRAVTLTCHVRNLGGYRVRYDLAIYFIYY
jgi:hypothetical protein